MTMAVLLLAMVCLALTQGGFLPEQTCLAGVGLAVVAAAKWFGKARRGEGIPKTPLLFVCIAAACLLSSLVHGATLTTLSMTGSWASVAAMSLLAASQDDKQRERTVWALVWAGVALSVAGMLVVAEALPLRDGMVGERLQFTFQYANAAGAWYAAAAFLCLLSPDPRQRSFALVPVTAFLLTQSGGALVAFLLVAVFAGAWLARRGRWGELLFALAQGVASVLLFAAFRATRGSILAVAVAACAIGAGFLLYRRRSAICDHKDARRIALAALGLMAVLLAIGLLVLRARAAEASSTFVERLLQARDGLVLWSSSPLLGVGPDNWRYLYRDVQSAPYTSAVVHCSFVQLLLDCGLLGFVPFAAACYFGLTSLAEGAKQDKGWGVGELCAASAVLVHCLLDFDLRFGSLALLLSFLISGCGEPVPNRRVAWLGIVGSVACLALCAFGFLCGTTSLALRSANGVGDYASCVRLYSGNPLAWEDPSAQEELLQALYRLGEQEAVITFYEERVSVPTDAEVACYALSLRDVGRLEEADETLVTRMESYPYGTELRKDAEDLAATYGMGSTMRERYDAALAGMAPSI